MNKIYEWFSYKLPPKLIYWVLIRVFGYVSTHKFHNIAAGDITLMGAIYSWKDELCQK